MLCIPFIILEGRNKMSNWIAKLFEPKYNPRDIVNFIRTEYANDVRHMRDEDVIHFYNNITTPRRRA
jgi:uncharacterized protein YehS (DUF1456 family)|tara:strand:+ start:120 stop:320 length:201 start_codon:yes stop_codon:yes gene_type:complete